VFQEGGQVRRAAMLGDFGEVWRIVGAFAQYCVAVDAVVAVPGILAAHDGVRDLVRVGQLGKLAMAVYRKHQEDQRCNGGGRDGEHAGLTFIHHSLRGQTPMPDQYATPMVQAYPMASTISTRTTRLTI